MKYSKKIIVLAGLFFLATQTSCIKKQNLEDNGLGPAISAEEVEQKMAEGVAGVFDPDEIRHNESNTLSAASTYEDSQTIKIFTQNIIVGTSSSVVVSGTPYTVYNLDYSKIDNLNPNQSFSNMTFKLYVEQSPSVKTLGLNSEVSQKASSPYFLYGAFMQGLDVCRIDKVTCHNLTVQDGEIALSQAQAHPAICQNVLNCKVPTRRIEFDLIDHNDVQSDGQPARYHYTYVVSSKLPFFSKVLKYCVRTLVEMQDRKVLAEDCINVNDFSAGD